MNGDLFGADAKNQRTGDSTESGPVLWEWKYKSSTKNSPSVYTVSFKVRIPCQVTISREGWAHRVAKQYGISEEVQLGDPSFDKEFYIDTYAPTFAKAYLADPDKREAIRQIMKGGFDSVTLSEEAVNAVKSPARFDNEEDKATLARSAGPILQKLSVNIPMASTAEISAKKSMRARLIALFAPPVLMAGLGPLPLVVAAQHFRPIAHMPLAMDAAKVSAAALALLMWTGYMALRGTSSAAKYLVYLLVISMFSFMFASWGTMMFLNGYMDEGPTATHTAHIMEKYVSQSKSTKSYFMRVSSWREDMERFDIQISYDFYQRLEPGSDTVILTTGQGWLGHEWLVSYQIAHE
ncbi:MAG: hypothetical protein OEV92_03260 [Nitrospinota bacterium]|nr:hypothetical protein [Nitrospinota bacterium]